MNLHPLEWVAINAVKAAAKSHCIWSYDKAEEYHAVALAHLILYLRELGIDAAMDSLAVGEMTFAEYAEALGLSDEQYKQLKCLPKQIRQAFYETLQTDRCIRIPPSSQCEYEKKHGEYLIKESNVAPSQCVSCHAVEPTFFDFDPDDLEVLEKFAKDKRDLEIIRLIRDSHDLESIATALGVHPKTVKRRLELIVAKVCDWNDRNLL